METNTKIIIFFGIIFLLIALSGTHIRFEEKWKEKYVEFNGYSVTKNVFNYQVDIFCKNEIATGFCYNGEFGNCNGTVTFEPIDNIIGSSKANDIILRSNGGEFLKKCTIRYTVKRPVIKSRLFQND